MKNHLLIVYLLFILSGCATSGIQTTVNHVTELQGAQKSEYFVPGTYKYKRVGLEASASSHGTTIISARLGQIAMDQLVKEAALGPNELLVDVVIERGKAVQKKKTVHVITIRGDVIELGTPINASLEPDWGSDLIDPSEIEIQTVKSKKKSRNPSRR